jgi:hypothetical protein
MSHVIQDTGPKQAKRDKYFALLKIGQLTPEQTAKAQKLAREITEADVKQARSDAEKTAKTEKARILYEARLEKCELARAELDALQPVTASMVSEFDTALRDAKALAGGGEYAKATEQLDKVSATHAPEKGTKAWNEAASAAEKIAPKAFEILKRIDELLADPQLRLARSAVIDVRRQKFEEGRVLLAPNPTQGVVDGATQRIQALHDQLVTDIDAGKTEWTRTEHLRAATSRKLNMIAPLSGDETPLLTDREAAPMRLQLASAATSMSVCDFAAARAVLQPLGDEIDDILTRMGPRRDEWKPRAAKLRDLLVQVQKFAAEAQSPQVKKDASALAAELRQLVASGPGKDYTLDEAIDLVDEAESRHDTLRGQEQAWLLFQGKADGPVQADSQGRAVKTLEAAKKSMEARFRAIDDALHDLHENVSEATNRSHRYVADAQWVQRRDAARAEWNERVAKARDAATLDEAGMRAQVLALLRDIVATNNDPDRLQAAIDTGKLERAKQAYTEARAAAQAACDALIAVDAAAGADRMLSIEQICAPATRLAALASPAMMIAAYNEAAASLKSTQKRIQKKEQATQGDVAIAQAELKRQLEAMAKRLLELKALADDAKNATKQKPLVALLDTLQATFNGLRATASLAQLKGLKQTKAEADAFELELDRSIAAAKGDSTDDAMSFDKARKAIANLKDDLGGKKYKLYCIVTHDAISEAVSTLEKGLGTITMTEMTTRIRDLRQQVLDMKLKADLAATATETFEKDVVKPLLKRVEEKVYDDAPEYRKSMKAKIEALVGEFRFEDGGQSAAAANAKSLGDQLTSVLQGAKDVRGVPSLLADEQAAALGAKNDKIVDQRKWEAEAEVLGKKLDQLKKLNPREVQPLVDLLDSTRTSTKKGGDYAGGRDQLLAIRKRLALIEANPHGLAITARNKLPQVNARVKKAIGTYLEALGSVDAAVQALPATDLDAAGKQAVAEQIAALRGLFNPSAFEEVAAKMSAKGGAREQRSGEREKGLREVRRMQGYLNSDIRLRTLRDSPWEKAMPSVLSELMLALLDIENNMLVSI